MNDEVKEEKLMALKNETVIVLFEDDFRINDNPALHWACKQYSEVVLLYIYNSCYIGREIGSASKVFLHYVLKGFTKVLETQYQTRIVIKQGDKIEILREIIHKTNASGVYFNQSYTQKQMEFESSIMKVFSHIKVRSFKAKLLFHPWQVKTSSKGWFQVFTPFSKACLQNIHLVEDVYEKPKHITNRHNINSLNVEDLELLPKNEGNWHSNVSKCYSFDYDEIYNNFNNFIETKLQFYEDERNFPSKNVNAGISSYLRFGVLSPKVCFHVASLKLGKYSNQFNLELLWREFAYHVMYYNQNIANVELKPQYSNFEWNNNAEFFQKWQKGQTGFEIVDAGMKEIYQTGKMHNRVRMIVASFLTKDLQINWKEGEKWFWNCLTDADPAVNPFSWQWVFGSGFDSAPYFRIFNPELQHQRFDADNSYCTKWLQGREILQPIVSHKLQKQIALEKYKKTLTQQMQNKNILL